MGRSYLTVVTRKGQTTIPAELRQEFGLQEGDRLTWWIEDGKLHVTSSRAYVKRMSDYFESQRDPDQPSFTIEELNEARAETWTHRRTPAIVNR